MRTSLQTNQVVYYNGIAESIHYDTLMQVDYWDGAAQGTLVIWPSLLVSYNIMECHNPNFRIKPSILYIQILQHKIFLLVPDVLYTIFVQKRKIFLYGNNGFLKSPTCFHVITYRTHYLKLSSCEENSKSMRRKLLV